jgi:hypothetical protein
MEHLDKRKKVITALAPSISRNPRFHCLSGQESGDLPWSCLMARLVFAAAIAIAITFLIRGLRLCILVAVSLLFRQVSSLLPGFGTAYCLQFRLHV